MLYKLLLDLGNIFGQNRYTDLIQSNIMKRNDGTWVITDPA
jgi:hypothetical protein